VDGPSNTTVFVYDASGKLVAEYSTNGVPVQDAKVSYLTADHLGSPRINTDANGAVTARHDYHPFGEEINGVGGRTTGLNYGSDTVRKQFTGYERDTETSLDFAQARMYANHIGRFTSVDRENISADSMIPQSWNAYSYVMNNPLVFVDPSGLIWLRQRMTDTYIWVDDDVYERNRKKDKKYYSDYIPSNNVVITITGGTMATPDQIGTMVMLSSDGNVYPITQRDLDLGNVDIGTDDPLQQVLDGMECRGAMWFWRPVIYTIGTAEMAALAAATAAGAGATAGEVASLSNSILSRGGMYANAGIRFSQTKYLDILFKTGRIDAPLTKRAVEAALEVSKRYISEPGRTPAQIQEHIRRIGILEKALKKMGY